MSQDTPHNDPAPDNIADRNVERLLSGAYEPESPDPEFVARATAAMHEAAREPAVQPKSATRGMVRLIGWTIAASLLLGMGIYLGHLLPGDRPKPGGETTIAEETPEEPELRIPQPSTIRVADELADGLGLVARRRTEAPPIEAVAVGDTLKTTAGQRRRVELPDGSVVYLNENSELTVDRDRHVTLKRGELYVEVQQQTAGLDGPKEKFIVATADRQITALGTKFYVRATDQRSQVTVTQGKVAVSDMELPLLAGQQLALASGEQDASRPVVSPSPRASHLLDWTRELMALAESPLVPASDHAGGSLVVVDPNGQEAKLSMRKYHVDVYIEDGFARTTIDQTYFNHLNRRLEGTFYFPLPPDASLSRLAMYVGENLMEGGMVERERARQVFEEIVTRQKDPALLEWIDGSTFKMRVFPLEPRQEKRIVMSYTQKLPSTYGRTDYRFPGGHNMSKVGRWSSHLRVKGGAGLRYETGAIEFEKSTLDGDLILDASAEGIKPDRDVVLTLHDKDRGKSSEQRARFASTEHEDSRYLMLRWRPKLPRQERHPRRDWIFLVETSADRDPLLARVQTDVVKTLLENAEHDDTFAIVTAGTHTGAFAAEPQAASPKNVKRAVRFLERTHLIGALDLGRALDATHEFAKGAKNPVLVHIGSGVPVLGEKEIDALRRHIPKGAKYVGVGVGNRWARNFMKTAATETGGYFTQINPDEQVNWRAFDLLSVLNSPRLLGIRVIDTAERLTFLCHRDSVVDGEELCAIARFDASQPLPKSIEVTGLLDGKLQTYTIRVADVAEQADYLPRTWAKLEIDRLVAEGAAENQARIVELSKAMYVMSPFTSLLVLENEAMYAQYKVDRGRKDHWALYPCPEKIAVVHEPLPSPAEKPEEATAGATKPSPCEVLSTLLVRRPPIVLRWPGEPSVEEVRAVPVYPPLVTFYNGAGTFQPNLTQWGINVNGVLNFTTYNDFTWSYQPNLWITETLAFHDRRVVDEDYDGADFQNMLLPTFSFVTQTTTVNVPDGGTVLLGGIRRMVLSDGTVSLVPFSTNGTMLDTDNHGAIQLWNPQGIQQVPGYIIPAATDRDINGLIDLVATSVVPNTWDTDLRVARQKGVVDALYEIERAHIPFPDEPPIVYPDAHIWQELSARRIERYSSMDLAAGGWLRLSLEDALKSPTRLEFIETPLSDVAEYLEDYHGIRIRFDNRALADIGLDANEEPITKSLKGISLRSALRLMLHEHDLTYVIQDDGTMLITTPEDARERLGTRVYPVADLVLPVNGDLRGFVPTLDRVPYFNRLFDNAGIGRETQSLMMMVTPRIIIQEEEEERLGLTPPGVFSADLDIPFTAGYPVHTINWSHYLAGTRPQRPRVVLYERPRFEHRWSLYSNLPAYAPGLNTCREDLVAAVDAEAEHQEPAPGKIDPQARKLFAEARSTGWQRASWLDEDGEPVVSVDFDGTGRFRYGHTTARGLAEEVICDGTNLWHLYEEIGLGARRDVGRLHRQQLMRLVPWALPPVEDLARAADVVAIGEKTVAVVPHGIEQLKDKDGKPLSYLRMHLVFDDGRLAERRMVRMPEGKVLLRQTFAADGTVTWLDKDDKVLAEQKIAVAPCGAPQLKPDEKQLVILPLPLRNQYHLIQTRNLKNEDAAIRQWSEEDALAMIAADVGGHGAYWWCHRDASEIIVERFLRQGDRRIGFYTLLIADGHRWDPDTESLPGTAKGEPLLLDPLADHPDHPLAKYIVAYLRMRDAGDDESKLAEVSWPDLPRDGLLGQIAEFDDLWRQLDDKPEALKDKELRRQVFDFIGRCRSRDFAWALLAELCNRDSDPSFYQQFAEAVEPFEHVWSLGYFARYERAAALLKSGKADEARELFATLYEKSLAAGILPPIDGRFRAAFRDSNKSAGWEPFVRETLATLLDRHSRLAAIRLAEQLDELGDDALAEEVFTAAITGTPPEWRLLVDLSAIRYLVAKNRHARADAIVQTLLADERYAARAPLWRLAAKIAEQRGRTAEALKWTERAMQLEFDALPEKVDVKQIRQQYGDLLDRYQALATSVASMQSEPPQEFVARVIAAADRWRVIDTDPTEACHKAARILGDLGAAELAWDYLTTPLAARPNEAAPWLDLAKMLRGQAHFELADRAYASAFAAEQTNAQILWDRAQVLLEAGKPAEARKVFAQLAAGEWQPRFEWLKTRAKAYVEED